MYDECSKIIRAVLLTILVMLMVGVVVFSSANRDSGFYNSLYANSLPCLIIDMVTLFPEMCHCTHKIYVKCIVSVLTLMAAATLGHYKFYDFSFAVGVGCFYAIMQWCVYAMLCNETCRKDLRLGLNSVAGYHDCCKCFVDNFCWFLLSENINGEDKKNEEVDNLLGKV